MEAIDELHKLITKEDNHLDIPKPKDMNFPMHSGKQFVDNVLKCDWADKILMEKATQKGVKK